MLITATALAKQLHALLYITDLCAIDRRRALLSALGVDEVGRRALRDKTLASEQANVQIVGLGQCAWSARATTVCCCLPLSSSPWRVRTGGRRTVRTAGAEEHMRRRTREIVPSQPSQSFSGGKPYCSYLKELYNHPLLCIFWSMLNLCGSRLRLRLHCVRKYAGLGLPA